MLSKLFTSARNLLDRPSQTSSAVLRQTEGAPDPASEMVTTRRQSGQQTTDRSDGAQSTPRAVSGSSKKRQAPASDSEDSESVEENKNGTPSNKKQKVLPVRAKDDKDVKRNTRVVVEIPVRKLTPEHGPPPNSSRRKPGKASLTSEQIDLADDGDSPQSKMEIPDSESDGDAPEIGQKVKTAGSSGTGQPKASVSMPLPDAPKAKHKRFGSEEPEVIFSTAVEQNEPEDESSDDDAPEVVGAQDAWKEAKRKETEAARAIEERESAARKKRKERDSILKRQASNKRRRENDAEANPKKPSSSLKLGPGDRLPEFLPEEFLEDNESEDEDETEIEATKRTKKARKTKFTELVDEKPKDIRKGTTTYRVAEVRSTKLAPKSASNARSVKESWQRGRAGASRKAVSTGFFKKR